MTESVLVPVVIDGTSVPNPAGTAIVNVLFGELVIKESELQGDLLPGELEATFAYGGTVVGMVRVGDQLLPVPMEYIEFPA